MVGFPPGVRQFLGTQGPVAPFSARAGRPTSAGVCCLLPFGCGHSICSSGVDLLGKTVRQVRFFKTDIKKNESLTKGRPSLTCSNRQEEEITEVNPEISTGEKEYNSITINN